MSHLRTEASKSNKVKSNKLNKWQAAKSVQYTNTTGFTSQERLNSKK